MAGFSPLVVVRDPPYSGRRPYVQVAAPAPESTDTEQEQPKPERAGDFQSQPVTQPMDLDLEEDFEFKRLKAMYRLLKDCGYTLRITKQEETVLTPREDSASTLPRLRDLWRTSSSGSAGR